MKASLSLGLVKPVIFDVIPIEILLGRLGETVFDKSGLPMKGSVWVLRHRHPERGHTSPDNKAL